MTDIAPPQHTRLFTFSAGVMFALALLSIFLINRHIEADRVMTGLANVHIGSV